MVVVIHVAPTIWTHADINTLACNFYDIACRSAVPLFFMMSGQLFLGKPQGPSIKRLYRSNVLKLVVVYAAWTLIYTFISLDYSAVGAEGWSAFAPQFVESMLNPHYHLWFLPVMIVVYLLIPALYALAHFEKGKYLLYSCIVFSGVSIIAAASGMIPSITNDFPGAFGRGVAWVLGYSGYFLWGYYLSTKDFSRARLWQVIVLLAAVIIATVICAQIIGVGNGSPRRYLYANLSLPVLLAAVLIYVLFIKLKPRFESRITQKASVRLSALSAASLAVYLIHPAIVEFLEQQFGSYVFVFTPWLSIPLFALGVFVVCLAAGLILKKLPFIKKWIV